MPNKKHICVIPTRMGSTRFPHKPLAKICGIPMIGHIAMRATLEPIFDEVIVATCDKEIVDYCNSIHIKVIMTSDKHERATDRTQEATEKIERELNKKFDFVTMLQGDEPMVTPNILRQIVETFNQSNCLVLNLVGKIENQEEFFSKNCVKVTMNNNKEALYFSRSPIPGAIKEHGLPNAFKQLGIIGFKRDFLNVYSSLKPTYLEQLESIDMLRCLEHDYKIKFLIIEESLYPVDVKSDIVKVETFLSKCQLLDRYKLKANISN